MLDQSVNKSNNPDKADPPPEQRQRLIIKKKNRLYNEHYPSILLTLFGETEYFSGRIGALRWSILVGKQKHNVQKPTDGLLL